MRTKCKTHIAAKRVYSRLHRALHTSKKEKMKAKYSIIMLLLIIGNSVFGQSKCEFKILFEKEAMNEDLIFVDEGLTSDGEWKKIRNRIISADKKGNTYNIKIGIVSIYNEYSTCFATIGNQELKLEFKPLKNIDELEFTLSKYQEISIKIKNISSLPKRILLGKEELFQLGDKYKTFPEKFEIVENDTINRYDKYGQRQGKWKGKYWDKDIESYYKDSKVIKYEIRGFYESGELECQYFKDDFNAPNEMYYRGFYKTGEVKEENYHTYGSPGKFKVKWYPNKIISQENYYDGEHIIIKQFKENGELECECITKAGTGYFKGWITDYNTNEFNIPCKYFDKEGNEIKTEEKLFKLHYDIKPK